MHWEQSEAIHTIWRLHHEEHGVIARIAIRNVIRKHPHYTIYTIYTYLPHDGALTYKAVCPKGTTFEEAKRFAEMMV